MIGLAGVGRAIGRIGHRDDEVRRARGHLRALVGLPLLVLLTMTGSPAEAPVADAAQVGDVESVRRLLSEGQDVDGAQGDGMTGLHWAALRGDVALAEVLIQAGAELNPVTRIGSHTPLHAASRAGQGEVVEVLVRAGADVRARTDSEVTPLHLAASSGSERAVRALVAGGAEVDAPEGQWDQTPLMFAAALGRVDAVRVLLESGADGTLRARVMDLVERDVRDRADQRARSQEIARMRAEARGEVVAAPVAAQRPAPPRDPAPTRGGERGETASAGSDQASAAEREAREIQQRTGEPIPLNFAALVGTHGGLSAIHLAAREGHGEVVETLIEGGVDINLPSAADGSTPMLVAAINGYFDLVDRLLDLGANPTLASEAGATPLYAVLNMYWAPKARHPQPLAYEQQEIHYLDLMRRLLEAGADVNARLNRTLWYTTYNRDLLGVDRTGATPFWRAAYALDIPAMKLLLEFGADPGLPTIRVPERRFGRTDDTDHSGLPPVPLGGPAVYPIHAAAGVGYGQGFAGNSHRHVPGGWIPALRFLVEDLGADVNARDYNGYTPLHHAAARGDNEMILYLVERGADVTAVARSGQTTVDMANGPVQRIEPFPETIALLESLGAENTHRCVSC